MKLRSGLARLLTVCLLTLLSGCFEYRLQRPGLPDLYIGGPYTRTKKHLDPRLGPKGKLYLRKKGNLRPYLSGDFYQRRHLSPIIGVMWYTSNNSSIEIGYRRSIWENRWRVDHERGNGSDQWRTPEELFYIGGKIVF